MSIASHYGVFCRTALPATRRAPGAALRGNARFMFAAALAVGALLSGCATDREVEHAPTPEQSWTVPNTATYSAIAAGNSSASATAAEHSSAAPSPGQQGSGPPAIDPNKAYELAELIDIAQRTNPQTRVAWERAREAALGVGIAESVYAPMLSAQAVAAAQRAPFPLPKTVLAPEGFFVADTQFFLPALTLKWLLFDFGGKQARVDATKEGLAAANFGFNATHQKIVFDVTRTYYILSAVQGRVEVARSSLSQAQTLQDAAESRRGRGLATLPEVLQARERTARAAYELQETFAGETDARMALLEAMGVRPTTPLRIAGLGARALPASVEQTAEKLVARALEQRPDLLAHAAVVREREADIRKAQSEFRPKIVVTGNVLQNIGRVSTSNIPGWATVNDTGYGAAISIEVPLYDGSLRQNRLRLAESQRRVAEDELELARDQTARQVVKAYEDLKVALQQREAAVVLLAAANKSYDAALDSYRHGVATFVDVTNAQTGLTKARTADTETRSSVFTAVAALAFGTGDIAPPGAPDALSGAAIPSQH
ncbi:MAG TPA: TolC family protein [Burkholderiales bacterium]|nr:TolC family protein [Burkholderiales bacterium]